jgi:DNA polymerase III subunit gamma/tau
MSDQTSPEVAAPENYRVLARKYRPGTFGALIGQDAMVRTLSNAIASGRLAHAFLLTGVRGVGKTSTARLIAKALNCVGIDGTGSATMSPCGVCEHCTAIGESRHLDVIEMDAASRTGVDDVREIIEGVRYAPVSARYKIYIIDEVHMLSKNAFNALLKTLEEPPPHVKFLFATTEIRKVPVTVLSRCQRFDLKRISQALLVTHFQSICETEKVSVEGEALQLIARAAEGSVRDGLSILDQAIAHGHNTVSAEAVRDMLGLADRFQVLALMDAILRADASAAMDNIRVQYDNGADPATIIEDLLALTHAITRAHISNVVPEGPEAERAQILTWVRALKPSAAHRLWQMLLKGLGDVNDAPSPIEAAEMLVLRIQHAAHMPDPGDILAKLESGAVVSARAPVNVAPVAGGTVAAAAAPQINVAPVSHFKPVPVDFSALVKLFEQNYEGVLGKHLRDDVEFVALDAAHLTLHPLIGAPRDLPARLKKCLDGWTGETWQISMSDTGGQATLRAVEQQTTIARDALIKAHPLVVSAQAMFPKAEIAEIIIHDDNVIDDNAARFEDMSDETMETYG